ncbi:glycosyltransferase [Nocardia sp. NPDC057668]|uniref:glycosyltransferase n=1 Tax=Nocardia sp. NPDC057668 TaxID=3346202 RepID=UPI00367043F5
MSRIVIVAIGTRGDVAPLTGLGLRLRDAGHEVAIAAHEPYAAMISGCGLRFIELGLNFGFEGTEAEIQDRITKEFNTRLGFRVIGEGLIAALRNEPVDLLLLSPYAEFAGHPFAQARGIPTAGVRLQHMSATGDFPPSFTGAWSRGRLGNRLFADAGAWVVDRYYRPVIAGFRRELGLPRVSARTLRRRRTAAEWPILHGFSPTLVPRPADWRPGLEVMGFWWPARPADFEPPAALVEFLAAGPPPVLVSFGSNMNSPEHTAELGAMVRIALRAAGVRGLVQAGWSGLGVTDEDVLNIGEIPYDWLFPQLAAAVHHCGAGTCAAALRAGIPTVAVPKIPEQRFWAHRTALLGVTADLIPESELTAPRLTDAITRAVTDTVLRANAVQVAARITAEDGAGETLRVIEELLARAEPATAH